MQIRVFAVLHSLLEFVTHWSNWHTLLHWKHIVSLIRLNSCAGIIAPHTFLFGEHLRVSPSVPYNIMEVLACMLQDDRQNRRWWRSDSRFQCYILSLGNLLKTQAMCKDISNGNGELDLTHACSTWRRRMQIEIMESGVNNSVAEVHWTTSKCLRHA